MRVLNTLITLAALAVVGCDKPQPPSTPAPRRDAATQPVTPLVPKVQLTDWCPEHGVPESICTRCNDSLVADFKKKGDWCDKHNLPDSQCTRCHPELEARFKAMAPKPAAGA